MEHRRIVEAPLNYMHRGECSRSLRRPTRLNDASLAAGEVELAEFVRQGHGAFQQMKRRGAVLGNIEVEFCPTNHRRRRGRAKIELIRFVAMKQMQQAAP